MQIDALRAALRQHRLDRGFTFEALVAEIATVVGDERKLSLFTVRAFIEGSTKPYDTTAYVIQEYLKSQGVEVAA